MKTEEEILKNFVEVEIIEENESKIRETLRRIGILSKKTNELYQSCHLLKKKGKFYIVHYKEMFILNSLNPEDNNFTIEDKSRRDKIAFLLQNWNLLKIKNPEVMGYIMKNKIDIIPHKDKNNFILKSKYKFSKFKSSFFSQDEN